MTAHNLAADSRWGSMTMPLALYGIIMGLDKVLLCDEMAAVTLYAR